MRTLHSRINAMLADIYDLMVDGDRPKFSKADSTVDNLKLNMENSRKQHVVFAEPDRQPESDSAEHQQGHLDLSSSPNRSSHDTSAEYNRPPTLQARLAEDSPARSSISSDRSSLTHGPSPTQPENPITDSSPTTEAAVSRSVRNEPPVQTKKTDPAGRNGKVEEGGGSGRRSRPSLSILKRAKREQMTKRAALGFRFFGFLFCLVSFSVMAADRNQGWALDSFDRYKEFRYCMIVNVIGFVYSGAQAVDLGYQLATGKSFVVHHLHYYFDFVIDQIIGYLLISASSSAATRIDDWKSNWGDDKFPDMATAAVSMSFLAFLALAFSALISGYALCTSKSM